MGHNVGTYRAILDREISLNLFGNEEHKLMIPVPDNIVLDNRGDDENNLGIDRPVLSYFVDPSNDVKNMKFKVLIRQSEGQDVVVSHFTLTGGHPFTVFEIIPGSQLQKGEKNLIIFRLEKGGTGSFVNVQNVIFWFMRRIEKW